ncbi:MAG: hypothetical protein HY985_06780 [Magnetospirillum sp.]|nr:hypothetical protein [Magnetospirillum sp.]
MDWKILLDLLVSVLLVATIGYAVMLNSRLTALRKNRDDLAKIIVAFNDATVRAESSIPKLKKAAEDAGAGLQERVEKAQSLRDDIAFMIERADTMANRLENAVRGARNAPAAAGAAPAAPTPAPRVGSAKSAQQATAAAAADSEIDERSEAERELLRALQAMR